LAVYEIPIEQVTGESAGHHGRLRVDLSPPVKLPNEIRLSAQQWASGITDVGIPLACMGDKTIIRWDPRQHPHWLISGTTGAGKTVAERMMITAFVATRGRVIVLDPKGGSDYAGLEGQHVKVVTGIPEASAALTRVVAVMGARQTALRERMAETGNYDLDIYDMRYVPLLIVLDEAASYLADEIVGYRSRSKAIGR